MRKNFVWLAIIGGTIAVFLIGKKVGATPTKRLTTENSPTSSTPTIPSTVVKTPTITYTPTGQTVINPAPGTAPVTPYPGATPVQPVAVIVPPNVVTSPVGQVYVYNPNTNQYAWTDHLNLPNLVAGGWVVVVSGGGSVTGAYYSTSIEALSHITNDMPYVAWSEQGWYVTDVYQGD